MFISTHEWGELANKGWDVLFLILINVCLFLSFFLYIMYVRMHLFIHSLFLHFLYIYKKKMSSFLCYFTETIILVKSYYDQNIYMHVNLITVWRCLFI